MQLWSRQSTKCLLCQFRQFISHPRIRPEYLIGRSRCFTSYPVLLSKDRRQRGPESRSSDKKGQERGQRRSTSSENDQRRKPQRLYSSEKSEDGQPRTLIRRTNQRPTALDEDQSLSLLRDYVPKALATVKSRLEAQQVARDGTLTPRSVLTQLDPDNELWPAFVDRISSLTQKSSKLRNAEGQENSARLLAAAARGHADTAHELYFEFLDFAFQPALRSRPSSPSTPIDLRYPTEWYSSARSQQRTIHLHVGPTNSGKTYNALKRLQESKNGFYAGPLRLLAHEVYSRFRANGIPCDLITGDDIRLDDNLNTKVYASTVEMVQVGNEVEVAVIDEIQMMGNEDRGWAWTRAFLGANAKEVHLCGETRVIPLIRELSASMGDTLHIHQYERLNPLRASTKSLRGNLKGLRKGDCIVAFSIMQIHALKKQIEVETGRRCAIVYGSLPPETRAEQADFFNEPNNDYDFLVASDAIGMGLNLSIKRIIFNSVSKFDGTKRVQLTVPQIKQIAGRAGRYRSAHDAKTKSTSSDLINGSKTEDNVGLVTCLDEADLPIIQSALRTDAPALRRAGILPPAEFLEEYSQRLPIAVPFEYLMRKVAGSATLHPRFFQCDLRDKLALARITDEVKGLTIEQRVTITAAPSPGRNPFLAKCLKSLAKIIATQQSVDVASVPEIPLETLAKPPTADRFYLEALEVLHQCLILYLWLSYRFMMNLRDRDMAMHAKHVTEQKINWTLRAFSANPKLRERLRKIQKKQQDLVEGHFGTGTLIEQQVATDAGDNLPDQPAEAYETDSDNQGGDVRPGEQDLQGEDFGVGETRLDLGGQLESAELTREQRFAYGQGPGEAGLDDLFEGESTLDIARPKSEISPSEGEQYPQTGSQQERDWDEHVNSETLTELYQEDRIDAVTSDQRDVTSRLANAATPSGNPSAAAEGVPTAKGARGEVANLDALGEDTEMEENEKLSGSANG